MNTISPIQLKNAAKDLPPSPRIFGRLGKLLKDPNAEFSDITELVNADSSLTAQVIRLSNSALYSAGMAIDTLDDAINRIGFRELFKLVGMAAAANVFTERNRVYDLTAAELWENSLACGIAMEILARKTGLDEQEAYTIGLLRNMGKMVIDVCAKADPAAPIHDRASGLPLIDWEEANIGITNPTVAGFILISWNFAEETSNTIQFQYEPEKAPRKLPLIHLLNLSNGLAERIGKGLHGEAKYWENWQDRLPRTGLSADEFEEASEEVAATLNKVIASVGRN